jgi:hypothetical protein
VAVSVSEIALGVGLGITGGSGAQVAAGHRQRINAVHRMRG